LAHSVFLTMRPFSMTVTFCKFGLNLRLVARWEKERLCPNVVVFPQVLHFAIVVIPFRTIFQTNAPFQGQGILPYNPANPQYAHYRTK
jgi:hypothetical protein